MTRNQMHYASAPVHYPTMPPQMYYGDYYPAQMYYGDDASHEHGCCNHNYFSGHSAGRPPYPYPYHHHMSPSPLPSFYPFCYPPAQGMYPPPPYFPPPHHRTTELPRYEYDMDMSRGGRDSCCGRCPYHPSSGEQQKDVKIEEVEPEVEMKTNASLVPSEAKNYPFPVVWLRPDKETTKPDDSRYKGWGGQANENPKSFSQQPILWNGWFPYDMSRVQSSNQEEEQKNNIQQLQEGGNSQQPGMWRGCFPSDLSKLETMKQGDEKGNNQHQKDDDKKRNFPFPVFWMPYKPSLTENKQEPQKTTENDISKKTESGVGKVASHVMNSQPEKHIDNEEKSRDMTKKTTSGEPEVPSHIIDFQPAKHTDNKEKPKTHLTREGSMNSSNTNRVVKIVPVKQVVSQLEGNFKTSTKTEDERQKKPLEECVNKSSTSPLKTSKLPPVCLRVEPLPKRKGTSGKSRSPSPPSNKRKSDDASAKQDGLILLPNLQQDDRNHDEVTTATDRSKEEKISNNTGNQATKVAEQVDKQGEVKFPGRSGDNLSHADATKQPNDCNEEPAADSDDVWKESGDLEAEVADTNAQSVTTRDSTAKAEESNKRKFSDAEAATVIQAAYHGFEVRKLGTLQKLKKLAEVKEKVEGIKTQIQALDSSCDVKTYDKQKTIITEMIMGLLLKLDAVQGLHTSIRDVRKSIAKELVSLQESLDALVIREKSSEAQLEQPSGISFEESMPNLKNEDITIECQRKNNGMDIHELSKIDHKVSPPVELCEKQLHETVSLLNPEELEKSEAMVTRDSVDDEEENVPGCICTEYFPGASDSAAVVGGSKKEQNQCLSSMADSSGDDEELELKQLFEGQDRSEVMSNFEDVSKEEIGKETSNVLQLAVNDEGLHSEDTSNDDPKKGEVSGDAVKDIADVGEVISSNQEQVALEESQEGSKECEEEKIADRTLLERPHESNDMSFSSSGENSIVGTLIEVPKESTNTCEADETTRTEIPTASEKAVDSWEPDETVSQDLCGLRQQVSLLPEDQKEQSLIEVSDPVHDAVQFEESKLQDTDHGWERDTCSESGSETAVPQQKCLNEVLVSPLRHDALQVEIQKEDHGQGVDSLFESVNHNDDIGMLLKTCEGVTDGLRKECDHLANEESGVKEELHENDYAFVSDGSASEVSPNSCAEKSKEMVNIAANEIENLSPVAIPREKMDATCLAPEDSSGTQHVTGSNNQANELGLYVSSPTASQASLDSETARELDRKLMEDNEKLREMMEKLLEAGSKQLITISELSGRINDLEKRLARKKKKQLKCRIRQKAQPPREVLV